MQTELKPFHDEHLFVESLALIALQMEGLPEEATDVERCIRFVEKIVSSERNRIKSGNHIEQISRMIDKKEIIMPFREHYDWYFEERYLKAVQEKQD